MDRNRTTSLSIKSYLFPDDTIPETINYSKLTDNDYKTRLNEILGYIKSNILNREIVIEKHFKFHQEENQKLSFK